MKLLTQDRIPKMNTSPDHVKDPQIVSTNSKPASKLTLYFPTKK